MIAFNTTVGDKMLLLLVIVSGLLQTVVSDITAGPQDRTAEAGDTVVFHCSTASGSDNLIWTKHGRPRQYIYNGVTKKISDTKKYDVTTDNKGNYNLTIYDVDVTDATPYSCETMTLNDELFANLVVIVSLTASVNPSTVAVGDSANLTCEVIYGAPSTDDSNKPLTLEQAPYMNMYVSGHDVTSSAIVTVSTNLQTSNKTWTVNHTFVDEDAGSEFQCTLSSGLGFESDTEIALNISAPTKMVSIDDDNSTIHNINEMVGCSGDGNPPPKVEWKPVHPWNGSNDGPDGPGWAKLHLKTPGKNMWNCTASNTVTSKDGSVKQNEAYQVVEFIVIEKEVPSKASMRLAIGLGVGLGLGIFVIIILVVVIILLMRKRKQQQNEKGMVTGQPVYAINAYQNPESIPESTYYTTPILPQQVAQSQQKVVGGSPGVPDLGVRHLGGSRSSLQLSQSFDATEKREFQPNTQFKGGHADVGHTNQTYA